MFKFLIILILSFFLLPVESDAQALFTTSFWQLSGFLSLGSFSITGVTGGTDSTPDAWLTDGSDPSITATASSGATSYDIVINNAADTTAVCSATNSSTPSAALAGCSLTNGTTYHVHVTAHLNSSIRTASNDGFAFYCRQYGANSCSNLWNYWSVRFFTGRLAGGELSAHSELGFVCGCYEL